MYNEIDLRIASRNKGYYYALGKLLKSKLPFKIAKEYLLLKIIIYIVSPSN